MAPERSIFPNITTIESALEHLTDWHTFPTNAQDKVDPVKYHQQQHGATNPIMIPHDHDPTTPDPSPSAKLWQEER